MTTNLQNNLKKLQAIQKEAEASLNNDFLRYGADPDEYSEPKPPVYMA